MSGKIVGGGVSAGGRKSYNGISDIPSGSRKMVQSLKEIVNCPEAEIYAVLKDCNMDPNEAVNRLLSQDPFHEVKSKKEKKKEIRDIPDSRARGYSNTYNRGTRGGSDRYAGRNGATSFSSSELGSFQGKTTNKRESEKQAHAASFSSTPGVSSHHQIPHSDSVPLDSKTPTVTSSGGASSSPSVSGHQTAWFGAPGQMSMADIVKMGRPHNKTTNSSKNVDIRSGEREIAANQHVPVQDEWPSIEKPMAASTCVPVAPTESEKCNGPADFQSSRGDQHLKGHLEDTHLAEDGPFGNLGSDLVQADTVAGGVVQEDDSGVSSEFDDQTQNHPVEHQKDEDDISSVAANLQELSVENHDKYSSHDDDRPAVVIPDHLLIHTEECSQLSFGSFGGFGSRTLNNNLEEASDVAPPLIERADARNIEFYGDEHLRSMSNGNMVHASTAENYDDSSESQREVLLSENPETAHQENQYSFPQSDQEYAYENAKQQLNTAFDASQTTSMQNLSSLTNVMQGYTNSIPNTLLAQTAQSARELELQYTTFPGVQSMPSRSNDSSLGGQGISTPEALRGGGGGGTQTTQPSQQNLPGANIATGPALHQQLPMHPYSQPTVPLTHFANMISYPMMPQSYPYMPSAFQQAFAGNSSYQQSLAALYPQYKNNISASNLPQSATSAPTSSVYGFGNSSNAGAGNFPVNQQQQQQQAAPTGATLSYEDVLNLQYKQNNHLLLLQQQQQQQQQQQHQQQQQNENSPVWLHGPGSQTMSGAQSNAYYNLQAQQQAQQLRQAQQQAQQQYGSLGYPNYYQSQTGMSMEHQQQNPRDGGGSQGQASKQTQQQQQLWQNSY
uniref:GBF-interacting protein 1 N-terminal domain-containing protein n=1 Tax=Noccaea caerulescens TaxID=107243 RepID=A0A1J3CXQ0_NOCCA